MADTFISYTSSDREWAFWLAKELKALDHTPHVHEWEINGSDDIYGWMERHHDAADHVLCVISDDYLRAPHSTLERHAALWQAAKKRPGLVLLVAVKPFVLPTRSDSDAVNFLACPRMQPDCASGSSWKSAARPRTAPFQAGVRDVQHPDPRADAFRGARRHALGDRDEAQAQ